MPTGVYVRTKKWRERMSKTAKKYGFGKWMKGKRLSEITKEKQRQANLHRKEKFGYYFSEETLKKLRKKRKAFLRYCLKCGIEIYSVPSKERKFCSQSCASSYFKNEIAKNWRGGRGMERHKEMQRLEYKLWRKAVFEKDNYTCQICGIKGGQIEANHKQPWRLYPELRYEIANGETLCKICHKKITKGQFKKGLALKVCPQISINV